MLPGANQQDPFYYHGANFIPAWISNYNYFKMGLNYLAMHKLAQTVQLSLGLGE